MKRHTHKTNSSHTTTMDIGKLYPIQFLEVMQGQTTYLNTSALARFQPLLAPTMMELNMHIVHFYVPYRLLWDGWNDFISGQKKVELPQTKINIKSTGFDILTFDLSGSQLELAGFPSKYKQVVGQNDPVDLNFPYLWFKAYHKIWDEHFRDEQIQTPIDFDALDQKFTEGAVYNGGTLDAFKNRLKELFGLRRVNWGRDRFVKALLETEADPTISLPISSDGDLKFTTQGSIGATYLQRYSVNPQSQNGNIFPTEKSFPVNTNLKYASGLTGIDMTDFKLATALYNFQMNQNKFGRDIEAYFRKYGIRNMDARLQRSETIGGFAETMQISDVIATDAGNLGKQGGHALGYAKRRAFKHYAPEWGVIITMAYLRPRAQYVGGIPRHFLKRDMLDFYQKEFESIGYQPIYKSEIGISRGNPKLPADEDLLDIFGYEPRYEEYRSEQSMVTGEVAPERTLSHWTNPRNFTDAPNLNSKFLECEPPTQCWSSPNTDKAIVSFNRRVLKKCFLSKRYDPIIKL